MLLIYLQTLWFQSVAGSWTITELVTNNGSYTMKVIQNFRLTTIWPQLQRLLCWIEYLRWQIAHWCSFSRLVQTLTRETANKWTWGPNSDENSIRDQVMRIPSGIKSRSLSCKVSRESSWFIPLKDTLNLWSRFDCLYLLSSKVLA